MRMKNIYNVVIVAFLILLGSILPSTAQETQKFDINSNSKVDILAARVSATPKRARLVIDLSEKTEFAFVSIIKGKKKQIAIDVKASGINFSGNVTVFGDGIISSVLMEKAEGNRVRTWLNLTNAAQVQQAYVLEKFEEQPARLVVDLILTTNDVFEKKAKSDIDFSAEQKTNKTKLGDHSNQPGELNVALTSRPLIILDPGHGGVDSGARAKNGKFEKDIVFAFALELQKLLVQSGRFDVALTRGDDSFLRLNQRIAVARLNKADLFISIHADSFEQSNVGGTSIYIRDEEATDVLDKILAKNENKSDIIAGFAPSDAKEQVVTILVDLMMRQMRKQAFNVANSIIEQLEPSVKMRRFPIRQADFLVLQSPDIPSILIELGFLSNSTDFKNLSTKEWQNRVAQAITRGVAIYFNEVQTN